MRSRRLSLVFICIYVSLFASLPAVSMAEVSSVDPENWLRSNMRKPSFRNELCSGVKDGELSIARLMVAGQVKIRSRQPPNLVIAETFEAKEASNSIEKLAATIAAEAIAAMVRQGQTEKPLSVDSAEVLCLAVLMNYDSYLSRNPHAIATEIELVSIAGTAFDEVFSLMLRAELLSRDSAGSGPPPS